MRTVNCQTKYTPDFADAYKRYYTKALKNELPLSISFGWYNIQEQSTYERWHPFFEPLYDAHRYFSKNKNYLKNPDNLIRCDLKHLLVTFEDIKLEHLPEEYQNDQTFIDDMIGHGRFDFVVNLTEDKISELLDDPQSKLYNYLKTNDSSLFDHFAISDELLSKAIKINKAYLPLLKTYQIQNPNFVLSLYQSQPWILNDLYFLEGGLKENQDFIINFIEKNKDNINLIDVLKLVDQNSLQFNFDAMGDTLSISSTTAGLKCDSYGLLDRVDKGFNERLINILATVLEPSKFCEMIEVIPQNLRSDNLFYSSKSNKCDTAYNIFLENISDYREQKIYRQRLHDLINPIQVNEKHHVTDIKEKLKLAIGHYTACWKFSIFGHHHEERAQHLLKMITNYDSVKSIAWLINNQIELFENKANNSTRYEQSDMYMLTYNIHIRPEDRDRWHKNKPFNLPNQSDRKSSGYYRALLVAKEILENAPDSQPDVVSTTSLRI